MSNSKWVDKETVFRDVSPDELVYINGGQGATQPSAPVTSAPNSSSSIFWNSVIAVGSTLTCLGGNSAIIASDGTAAAVPGLINTTVGACVTAIGSIGTVANQLIENGNASSQGGEGGANKKLSMEEEVSDSEDA